MGVNLYRHASARVNPRQQRICTCIRVEHFSASSTLEHGTVIGFGCTASFSPPLSTLRRRRRLCIAGDTISTCPIYCMRFPCISPQHPGLPPQLSPTPHPTCRICQTLADGISHSTSSRKDSNAFSSQRPHSCINAPTRVCAIIVWYCQGKRRATQTGQAWSQ